MWLIGGIVAVPLLLIGAAMALPSVIGWAWLKDPLTARLSDRLGYTVAIDGAFDVDLGRVVRINAAGIRLGNPDWARRPDMARIEHVLVELAPLDLLRGRLTLPRIALDGADIELERAADGRRNWQSNPAAEAVTPEERADLPVIERLDVKRSRIVYRDATSGFGIEAEAASVEGKAESDEPTLEVKGRGTVDKRPFTFSLVGGSILSLREGGEPYPLRLTADLGDTHLEGFGTMTEPVRLKGANIELLVRGGSVRSLFAALGMTAPETPPYTVKGRLRNEGDVWHFTDFVGTVGTSDIAGSLKVDVARERPHLTADVSSRSLDFYDLGPILGLPPGLAEGQPATEAQRQAAARVKASPRVLPDAPLDLDRIGKFDADVRFRAQAVKNIPVPISPVDLTVELKQSLLKLAPFRFGFSGGTANSSIVIDARKRPVMTSSDIRLVGMSLDQLMARLGLKDVASGSVRARIKLDGAGDSVRESLAHSNGTVGLAMGGGSISLLAMEVAGLDIAESLAFLGKKEKTVPVRCLAISFAVQSGIMEARALVLDTTDTVLTGKGAISLRNENLDLELIANPKDWSPLSLRTPIELKGTFKDPKPGIKPGAAVARGAAAAALGVALTPLAAILAFLDPGTGADTNCGALLGATPAQ
jgi:uncharacterized protein involved in outer membrane biogenesis